MKLPVGKVSWEQKQKLITKKKDFSSGKNISRIYLENSPEINDKLSKEIING